MTADMQQQLTGREQTYTCLPSFRGPVQLLDSLIALCVILALLFLVLPLIFLV